MINPTPPGRNCSNEDMWQHPSVINWTQLLLDSYHHWINQDLIERGASPLEQSRRLFECSFVVVSHGMQEDPILNYGNRTTLNLWEMSWGELIRTPSRLTAEPPNQEERAQMLERATQHGFIDDYRGIRISKTGKRFLVEQAMVWNVVDGKGVKYGQAATFSKWSFLESESNS